MVDFQIKYFAERLKEVAKTEFGGIGKLAELVGYSNLSIYTKSNPQEPKATFLSKLAAVGVDVNYLLTGIKKLKVSEPDVRYSTDIEKKINALDERLNRLEEQNTLWMKFSAECLQRYKEDVDDKEDIIAKLSVQFIALVAANQISDKLECGDTNINKE